MNPPSIIQIRVAMCVEQANRQWDSRVYVLPEKFSSSSFRVCFGEICIFRRMLNAWKIYDFFFFCFAMTTATDSAKSLKGLLEESHSESL